MHLALNALDQERRRRQVSIADEIARALGLTQANVLVRLHRIRERLRNTLKQQADE